MRELGVRGIVYQEVFGPAPEQCGTAVAALRDKAAAYRDRETPLVRIGVSPHAPYTVSDDLFEAVTALATELRLPMAIHIAESDAEDQLVRAGTGRFADGLRRRGIGVSPRARSPIALLDTLGVLSARPLLVHCVRVDADDLRVISAARCGIAHCPASNAKLGHGIAPLTEMLEAGIAVGIGSDSMASNNRMDLLAEARVAALTQRARLSSGSALPSMVALQLATLGGARALGLDTAVGSLEPGKEADLAAFPLDDVAAHPVYEPAATLLYGLAGSAARLVAVAGTVRVWDGRVIDQDPSVASRVDATAALLSEWRARSTESGAGSGA
jgi:cytosine/adenosine deaminase-related metal-dependent hydrolase